MENRLPEEVGERPKRRISTWGGCVVGLGVLWILGALGIVLCAAASFLGFRGEPEVQFDSAELTAAAFVSGGLTILAGIGLSLLGRWMLFRHTKRLCASAHPES